MQYWILEHARNSVDTARDAFIIRAIGHGCACVPRGSVLCVVCYVGMVNTTKVNSQRRPEMDPDELESVYINSNLLIAEVKKRPLLYDCYSGDYKDRAKKARSWEEVAAAVIFEWDKMNPRERTYKSKEVQVRWRSIRDAFIKDYKSETARNKDSTKPSAAYKQKRRYVFYDRLLFLIPVLNKRKILDAGVNVFEVEGVNNIILPEDKADSLNGASPSSNDTIIKPFQSAHRNRLSNSSATPGEPTTSGSSKRAFQNELLSVLMERRNDRMADEDDSDRLFLLSLLPELKKMNDDVKFDARIEILKVIKKYSRLSAQQAKHFVEQPSFRGIGYEMELVEDEENEEASQPEDLLASNSDCVDTEF